MLPDDRIHNPLDETHRASCLRENLTSSSHGEGLETGRAATWAPRQSLTRQLKYDGYRALTIIEHGRVQLISRNGHPFASFSALAESISDSLPNVRAVIDGEICSLDRRGRPQFKNLMFRHGNPCFFAFDLLTCDGKDLRTERLLDRKQELRRLLARSPATSPLKYTEYIDGQGMALFQRVCELDLEGIVAKQKFGPYVTERLVQNFESGIFTEGWQRGII